MASENSEASAGLSVKLKQLLMTCGRTNSVLESGKDSAVSRQIESLKELSKEVEKLRREVELGKITKRKQKSRNGMSESKEN